VLLVVIIILIIIITTQQQQPRAAAAAVIIGNVWPDSETVPIESPVDYENYCLQTSGTLDH
jgi:hypothetical protein